MNTKEFLLSKIVDTEISSRVKNVLLDLGCTFWFEVVLKHPKHALLKLRNFGKKSSSEVEKIFSDHGIGLQKWDEISQIDDRDPKGYQIKQMMLFEYESVVNIPRITETVAWSNFSRFFSLFESRTWIGDLTCCDFVTLSGVRPIQANILSKILSWEGYFGEKISKSEDRQKFELLVEEIGKLVSQYYQTESAQLVDKVLLV